MMSALISDIHSNIEALEAVLKDIEQEGIEDILCLGDLVGYGPDPIPVVDIIRKCCRFSLMGNHDWALFNEPIGFNPAARGAIEWTRTQLEPGLFSGGDKKSRWNFMKALALRMNHEGFLFVHAAPQNPTEEYLLRQDVDEMLHELSPKLKRAFEEVSTVCFVGHTHQPGVITEDARFLAPSDLDKGKYKLKEGQRCIVNVGSVGQPRDGDTRSCYLIVDDDTLIYRRVEYDLEKTAQKIFENKSIDNHMGERLRVGH
ncbi:MAG: metallophosphoesterase family protein [Planctomycetes bacterium]|nr:metallophosphoesterase family protein [Planctomycetota bacterium]